MDSPYTVYLAGPMLGCNDSEMNDWRDSAKHILESAGIRVLNPAVRDYRDADPLEVAEDVVEKDLDEIKDCDALLVNNWKKSTGTAMEIVYGYRWQKVIITVLYPSNIDPWTIYHTHVRFESLDRALKFIIDKKPTVNIPQPRLFTHENDLYVHG